MSTSKVTLGIFAGIAAGVAIGLLIAPEKGTELRTKLKKGAEDLYEKGKEFLGKVKHEEEAIKEELA